MRSRIRVGKLNPQDTTGGESNNETSADASRRRHVAITLLNVPETMAHVALSSDDQ